MINNVNVEEQISTVLYGSNRKWNLLVLSIILAGMITVVMTTKGQYDFEVDLILEGRKPVRSGEIKTLSRKWPIDKLRKFLSKGDAAKLKDLYKENDGDIVYLSPPEPAATEICADEDALNFNKDVNGNDPSDPSNVSGVYTFCKYNTVCNTPGADNDESELVETRRRRVNQNQSGDLVPVNPSLCNWCDTTSVIPSTVDVNSTYDVINWVIGGCDPKNSDVPEPLTPTLGGGMSEGFSNYKDEYTIKQEIWGRPKSNKMFELHRLLSLISIILIVYIIRDFMIYQNETLSMFSRPIALQTTADQVVIFLTLLLLIDYNGFLTDPKKTSLSIWRFTLLLSIIGIYVITYISKSTDTWTSIIQHPWLAHYTLPLIVLGISFIIWFILPSSETFKNQEDEENTKSEDFTIQDIVDNFVQIN